MSEPANDLTGAAAEAWLYFYPLLLMAATRDAEKGLEINAWKHAEALRKAGFKHVIRPNVDTQYSHAWLDLANGPVLLDVPDTDGRYYVVQAMDEWSLTFATVGSRTTGTGVGTFAFAWGDAKVDVPPGATVVRAPTRSVWLLLRIQNDGPGDADEIARLQAGFRLRAASGSAAPPGAPIPAAVVARIGEGKAPPQVLMGLVDNPIDRYNIGSRDALERDPDGAVTIHLSVDNPHGAGSQKTSNWLPIPSAAFTLTFRAYCPREPIVHDGDGWRIPPVRQWASGA